MTQRISAVVIARNEGKTLRETVRNLEDTLPGAARIVVVDDGSTDGCARFLKQRSRRVRLLTRKGLGVARARNLGARESSGEAIVFCDAHIRCDAEWWRPLVELIADPRVGAAAPGIGDMSGECENGYGLTLPRPNLTVRWLGRGSRKPRPVPVVPGACVAMRRDVFEATGGFDEGLLTHGSNDYELSLRLWMLGFECHVTPETVVQHFFRKKFPYPVSGLEGLHNRLRVAAVHLGADRAAKVFGALAKEADFGGAILRLLASDAAARRASLHRLRVRDDDWFFARFGINW